MTPRDRFSLWSILIISLVVVIQLVQNNGEAAVDRLFKIKHSVSSESISTDSFERLQQIDSEVKTAYAISLMPNSPLLASLLQDNQSSGKRSARGPLSSFHSGIENALDDSLDGLRLNPDSIYFARRVILLRGLLAINPLDPVARSVRHPGMNSPLNAYERYASEERDFAPQIRTEESFFRQNFSGSPIPGNELAARLAQLNDYPTLLYYGLIARQEILQQAGAFGEAKAVGRALQYRALSSMAGLGILGCFVFTLFLIGAIVWIGVLSALSTRRSKDGLAITGPPVPGVFNRFLYPRPALIVPSDRKLRGGDLLDCFAVYLFSLTGFGTVLEFLLHFIPKSYFQRLSIINLTYVNIAFETAAYVVASGIALAFLFWKARKLGASLANEIGFSTRWVLKSIVFGAVGWGAAAVLLLIVELATHQLLHKLPAPENPALPLLSFAPDTISRTALYCLAALAAPFFEETFFRGVLLNALLQRFRPIYACLITGLLFGGIHPVGIADALTLASLGAVFAWMAYLRKSLAPSMFAHCLQNSYAYFAVYFSFALILHR